MNEGSCLSSAKEIPECSPAQFHRGVGVYGQMLNDVVTLPADDGIDVNVIIFGKIDNVIRGDVDRIADWHKSDLLRSYSSLWRPS